MKIIINQKVYEEVMYLVDKCDKEISGLGKVKIIGDEVHIVKQYLLDQEVTATTTDIDEDAVSKLLYEAHQDGGLEEGELLWWWHSHVDMGVFWSGTDHATIKEFGKNGRIFATVFNKKREMRSAYYQAGNGIYPQCFVDNIETGIMSMLTPEHRKALDEQFEVKVREKKWKPKHNFNKFNKSGAWDYQGNKKKLANRRKKKTTALTDDLVGHSNRFNDSFFWDGDDNYMDEFWDDYFTNVGDEVVNGNK